MQHRDDGTRIAGLWAEGFAKGIEFRKDGSVKYEGGYDPNGRYHGDTGIQFFKTGGRSYTGYKHGEKVGEKCILYHESPPNVAKFRGEIREGGVFWSGIQLNTEGEPIKRWKEGVLINI